MKKAKLPKSRDPFTVHLVKRGGQGAHGQTPKAKRTQEKARLKANLSGD